MEANQKYQIFKAFSKPILDITDNFKIFFKLGFPAALILSVWSFICGQSFVCLILSLRDQFYCSDNVPLYIIYVLTKFLILTTFLRIWYDAVYLEKSINKEYFKTNIRRFFKFFGFFIGFIALNSLPALSLYLLLIRDPDPNWIIEVIYFTLVSTGFLVPFVLLRFYTNIACYLEEKPWRNFGEIYEKTNFKLSKIFFSFALVLACCLLLFLTTNKSLRDSFFAPLIAYNIFAEYCFELALITIFTLIINYIRVQKEIFE